MTARGCTTHSKDILNTNTKKDRSSSESSDQDQYLESQPRATYEGVTPAVMYQLNNSSRHGSILTNKSPSFNNHLDQYNAVERSETIA